MVPIKIAPETATGLGTLGGTVMFRCVFALLVATFCLGLGGCSSEPSATAAVAGQARDAVIRRAPHASHAPMPPRRGVAQMQRVAGAPQQNAEAAPAVASFTIISGEETGAYPRVIADLSAILDRDLWRFQPIASRGPQQDLLDLLHQPSTDIAIVQTDAVEALTGHIQAAAREKLRYLLPVPSKELHVLAPLDITDIRQLDGRRVNIDLPESGTHLTARLIFEKLGVKPEFTTYDQASAHQRLRSGEIQAAVLLAPRPSIEIVGFRSDGRFHLLPVSAGDKAPGYSQSQFTMDDYPHLIGAGRRIETLAVGRVLAIRDWAEGSPRYQRLARLIEAIHARLGELRQPGRDPRWKEVDMAAEVPGWQRFRPAQSLLDSKSRQSDERHAFERFVAASGLCALPDSAAARERFYSEFMEWRRTREQNEPPRSSDTPRR